MKKNQTRKKYIKSHIFTFLLGVLLTGTIGVKAATTWLSSSVTYDNSGSGMSAVNVQDAIDELYNAIPLPEMSAADKLIAKVVTSGDGLYADKYEEGRYVYKGAAPDNYITFNEEEAGWRIIAVEADGTIKIIKNGIIGQKVWSSGGTDWANASLRAYLNEDYQLTLLDRTDIQNYDFGVGAVTDKNNDLAAQIVEEKSKTWNGDIGLMSLSDYLRAGDNPNQCETLNLYDTNFFTCKQTNWMAIAFDKCYPWTITPVANGSGIYAIYNTDGAFARWEPYFDPDGVAPVIYLESNVKISGGGTSGDPYVVD